jgi:hypothetical protein
MPRLSDRATPPSARRVIRDITRRIKSIFANLLRIMWSKKEKKIIKQ